MLRIARIKSFVGVYRLLGFLAVLIAVVATIFVLVTNNSAPASALTTVPTRMNFQGRLADSTGNIKQNGTYNMRLRLYTAASGGTAVWTEDRLVSAGNGITLTNGLFALQLGSVTALPASLFASGPLYLEVELPTPATATSSSPSWTEGAMTPRNQMATSAYAYNAELLDGQDGDYYLNASNLNAGTVNSARITGAYANMTGTGALVSGSIASGFGTIATGNTIQGSRFISTVATGTAPLTVTSTTKVTNLNVDLLDGLDSTAFYRESLGSVAADFNNYTASGAYHVNAWSAGGVLNGPVGSYDWGMLDVQRFNGATYVSQTYRPHNTDIAWTRVLWAGTWTAWREAWGSANDGAGSGLDADLLDGLSSASFIQNTTTPQTANFNVSGNGTIGGALTVSGDGTVAGSLGVGTTNPGSKLQIGNSVQMNVYISEGSVTGNRWYYLGQANANNGTVLVDGMLGGHNSRGGNVSLAFTQRDGFSVTGSAYGGNGFTQGNIQVYRDASNNIKVYLKTASWALTNLTSRASSGATVTYDGTFTTTAPTDTLVFDLATDDSPGLIKIDNTGTGKIGSSDIMTSANSVLLQASSPGTAQTGNINISGTVIAGGFSGSGSGMTNLSANNLASGTVASARISGSYAGITGTGALAAGSIASGFGTIVTTNTIQGTRLISTTATGVAPLTVNSTTKVTNLNVDLLDGLDSTAFAAASGSSSYIQNSMTQQSGYFNITGNGVLGGELSVGGGAVTLSAAGLSGDGYSISSASDMFLQAANGVDIGSALRVASTLQGSRLITTVVTGTAPLTVTSTTKVANLNVDLLDGLNSTAFAAASGSGSYIQNTTGAQSANFNITGNGTVSGSFSASQFTVNGTMWMNPPGADNGVYLCHRGSDNLVVRAWTGCSTASSIRYKENVVSLDSSVLSLLNQLRPVSFDWKAGTGTAMNGSIHDYGLIAEEVRDILPHAVAYGANGEVTGLNYQAFIPFLMQAIKEQQSQIVQLQGGNPSFTSLTVNGPATVQSLTVRGDAHVKGDIYVEGHLVSRGSTPTVDTSLLSCVDGILVTGTDIAGAIQFEVDEASCTSADLRFVFAKEYSLAPNATLTAKDRGSARLDSSLDASTDKMTFSFDGLQTGKTYRFTYHVIQ